MKKMLVNFESSILSRNEMKNINGGSFHCQAGNLVSTAIPRVSTLAEAQSACNASSYCQNNGPCTAIVQ